LTNLNKCANLNNPLLLGGFRGFLSSTEPAAYLYGPQKFLLLGVNFYTGVFL